MSALDAFLDLCDADPDFDSGDEDDDPFDRLTRNTDEDKRKLEHEKKTNAKEFEELFGTAVQLKQNSKSSLSKSVPSSQATLGRTQSQSTRFTPRLGDSDLINDPYTLLRLFKNSIQMYSDEVQTLDLSLRERNLTIPYTPLSKVFPTKDKLQFWTSGVLVKKVPGIRKSAKGNDYVLWEISDLDTENSSTLFLFGSSASSDALKIIPVGSLVDLVNPTLLNETHTEANKIKFSVSNSNQIRHVGTSKDFGLCGSKRKDGKDCANPVNKFKCDVCIHHASAELKKLNSKNGKSKWAKKSFTDFEKMQFAVRMEARKPSEIAAGVVTMNLNRGNGRSKSFSGATSFAPPKPFAAFSAANKGVGKSAFPGDKSKKTVAGRKPSVRMELQDSGNALGRSPTCLGNHASISFSKDTSPLLNILPKDETSAIAKKELNLDPHITRHLTERDRVLLDRLDKARDSKSDLPTMLVDPNAGSKNFLKYLSNTEKQNEYDAEKTVSKKSDSEKTPAPPGPLIMTRETLGNMQKALKFVNKTGPITKNDPNSVLSKKRKLTPGVKLGADDLSQASPGTSKEVQGKSQSKQITTSTRGNVDLESEEFQKILNAKSAHESIAESNQQEEYFAKLERKEAIENKLLNTFSIATTAVMCRDCKYVAVSQSDFCKENRHPIRVVKAVKRFFKCKDCGNRTMSLDRLPRRPCAQCKSSHWLPAPVGKEKAGPTLDSERLVLRGDEEMFLGSSSSKLFL